MASEVERAVGQGFFNAAGQAKSKETLAAENKKAEASLEAKSSGESTPEKDTSVKSALKSVSSRFSEDANSVINVINENDSNLKAAQKNVKAQVSVAKDLKNAIKDGDTEKADKKRAELAALQGERDKIAEKVQADNDARVTERTQSISFGNKPKKLVSIEKVEFQKTNKNQDLESAQGVDNLIDSLKNDQASIKSQRTELRETRKEVKQVVNDVRSEISRIEKASVATEQEAQKLADKVASDIVRTGSQQAVVSNVEESVVKSLLGS